MTQFSYFHTGWSILHKKKHTKVVEKTHESSRLHTKVAEKGFVFRMKYRVF